jgi:hypothetical protein
MKPDGNKPSGKEEGGGSGCKQQLYKQFEQGYRRQQGWRTEKCPESGERQF